MKTVKKVAVFYHHFAHYRGAVLEALLENQDDIQFVFFSDDKNYHSPDIKSWAPSSNVDSRRAECVRIFGHVMWQKKIVRTALGREFDGLILLGDPYWPATWLGAALGRMRQKRILYWTIGWMGRESGLKAQIRKAFMRIPHELMLYGHYAKGRAQGCGIEERKIHVVYNSLDYKAQVDARDKVSAGSKKRHLKELFGDEDANAYICVSRLSAGRRLDLVIKAMEGLEIDGNPVHLLLVGDGAERECLEKLAKKSGVSVCFYGACYDPEVLAELTMACRATVAPGLVGLTAMQSLGYGIPVISHSDRPTQAPESESLMDGVTGYLFDLKTQGALADAMIRAAAEPRSVGEVRAACIAEVEGRWTPENQVQCICRAIRGEAPMEAPNAHYHKLETLGKEEML
ncbi:MAG: glycosyltransferase family 4 protein [Deltaproteobacteria bacterium]|nr:glycosyltransferase family 4 protein [Deltaproteobacteria bacterium]